MNGRHVTKAAAKGLAATAAIAAAGYAGLVLFTRARYGDAKVSSAARKDSLLDRFLPDPRRASPRPTPRRGSASASTGRSWRPA